MHLLNLIGSGKKQGEELIATNRLYMGTAAPGAHSYLSIAPLTSHIFSRFHYHAGIIAHQYSSLLLGFPLAASPYQM